MATYNINLFITYQITSENEDSAIKELKEIYEIDVSEYDYYEIQDVTNEK